MTTIARIHRDNEDETEFFVNDEQVGRANYDAHGSNAMHDMEDLFERTARALNAVIVRTGNL